MLRHLRHIKAFVATAALIDARKNFLQAYNKVAKPIVRGLLAQLGRDNEYTHFSSKT